MEYLGRGPYGVIYNVPHLDLEYAERMARFAIVEHNKEQNSKLEFVKLSEAHWGSIHGIIYDLAIEAKDSNSGETKRYAAQVWDKPWDEPFRRLKRFIYHPLPLPGIFNYKPGQMIAAEKTYSWLVPLLI